MIRRFVKDTKTASSVLEFDTEKSHYTLATTYTNGKTKHHGGMVHSVRWFIQEKVRKGFIEEKGRT